MTIIVNGVFVFLLLLFFVAIVYKATNLLQIIFNVFIYLMNYLTF